ncbi:hypothetical protein, partial [Photobacterium nomapromontoriensis]|uniref:hypothetical protein n=1 Tax=Photobacterium nomapromontoriensis TaxID=2910237 RepID=UPI003D115656
MYTNIDLNKTRSRHTNLKQKIAERAKKNLPYSIEELSQEELRLYLGGSEDEFKLMCRLLNYYLYLDELGFVSCKGKKLKDPILNTIRDKSYLLNEHHVLT